MIVACIPAIIIGLPLDDWLEANFHSSYQLPLFDRLRYCLYYCRKTQQNKTPRWTSLNDFTYQAALLVGLFQVLALVPGTSRSGATILGSILIGASRFVATEFSFS